MNFTDMIILAFNNLWKSKLRTFLTTLGVIVGIGALSSMVSFGTGMQKNITDSFKDNDLFTSMTVTSSEFNLEKISQGDLESITDDKKKPTPLNDSTLEIIQSLEHIEIAYAQESFPAKLRYNNKETSATVSMIPANMHHYKPYSELYAGDFYKTDSQNVIVVSKHYLRQMDIIVTEDPENYNNKRLDTTKTYTIIHPDSLIGKTFELITAVFDPSQISFNPIGGSKKDMPIKDSVNNVTIIGIQDRQSFNAGGFLSGGIYMSPVAASKIPRISFTNVFDLLDKNKSKDNKYSSIYVRVKDYKYLEKTRLELEKKGFEVFSIGDKIDEIKRVFLIFDSILGAIGTIALFVAALGIMNTLLMSILERRKEIGIMKSIGASEGEIKMIFFVEAATIGFIGGVLGLLLGWMVTKIANIIANTSFADAAQAKIDLFYFPVWLIIGAILFSILVSLLSGLYPASRAAKIDPVEALRHD